MHKKRYISLFLLITLVFHLAVPVPALAANPLRGFVRGLRNTVRFVVRLPDKATRWMGPILGPIAADLLTQNIIANPRIGRLFFNAIKIDNLAGNVEEQKKILSEVQSNFRNQAGDLRQQASDIRGLKSELERNLLEGTMTLSEYQDRVVGLNNLADAYDSAADKFTRSANSIKPNDILRMVSRNVFNQTLNQIRSGVQTEIKDSISRFIRPEVINTLIATQNHDFDSLLDALLAGDISSILKNRGGEDLDMDEVKSRVRSRIKDILKDNKDALRQNWRGEIDKVIRQVIADLDKTRDSLPSVDSVISPTAKIVPTSAPLPKDEHGCLPGYKFCARCGISCVQANCGDVQDGHLSYEGYCICGSAGSINENPNDPNKGCYYPATYASCPSCLYACVHTGEDCPLDGLVP